MIISSLFIIIVILMYQFVWRPEIEEAMKARAQARKNRALGSKA